MAGLDMWVLFFALAVATFFALGVTIERGHEALLTTAWVGTVFWTLIAAGVAVAVLDAARAGRDARRLRRNASGDARREGVGPV